MHYNFSSLPTIISQASDDQLNDIYRLYRQEKDRRALIRYHSGDWIPLSDSEKMLIQDKRNAGAIISYRRRTGYDLYFCKLVVEKHR